MESMGEIASHYVLEPGKWFEKKEHDHIENEEEDAESYGKEGNEGG